MWINTQWIFALLEIVGCRELKASLTPRQNGCHFPYHIFQWIFMNESVWISIKISLKFVSKCPINIIPALLWIIAWRWIGNKPLSEPMPGWIVYWCIYASLGPKELKSLTMFCTNKILNIYTQKNVKFKTTLLRMNYRTDWILFFSADFPFNS